MQQDFLLQQHPKQVMLFQLHHKEQQNLKQSFYSVLSTDDAHSFPRKVLHVKRCMGNLPLAFAGIINRSLNKDNALKQCPCCGTEEDEEATTN
jgi:hypothetical protein